MKQETVTIPKTEYRKLKKKADMNESYLKEMVQSLVEIKQGKVKRVI